MAQLEDLLVVDIETIPDKDHHDGDKFPITPFHQVVAIAFLEAAIHRGHEGEEYSLVDVRCGGDASYDESTLLQGFFQHFDRLKPRLVTYNGRSFDLPVLKYRAMLHGVQAPLSNGGTARAPASNGEGPETPDRAPGPDRAISEAA